MTPLWRNKEGCNSGNSTQISQTGEEEYEHLLLFMHTHVYWLMRLRVPTITRMITQVFPPFFTSC
jgi:hypothetical protein